MSGSFKQFISCVPFLYITAPLVIGIILGGWALLALPLLFIPKIRTQWLFLLIIVVGSSLKIIHNYNIPFPVEQRVEVTLVVDKPISNYQYCKVISEPYRSDILLSKINNIAIGDTISTTLYLEDIDKYKNETKSIFNSYSLRGVDYVGYIYDDIPIAIKRVSKERDRCHRFREKIGDKISHLSTSDENRAVLKALIIGDKDELLSKTKQNYRKAGVIHTLAVSGMHVGIIFLILNTMLLFLNLTFYSRVAKIMIITSLLICYASLCNFTPSVVRAVMMFSLFQLTSFTITSRYHNYNILFLSAFLMVAVDPVVIWDISFQLSYVAMFSVLFLASKSSEHQIHSNYFIRKIQTLVIVTTFVSLFMLPLALYYFGEGSFFSLFSNLAISILLPLLFIASLLYFISPLPILDSFIDMIFSSINFVIERVASWNIFYLTNVEFDLIDLTLSYLAILLIISATSFKPSRAK